MAASPVFKVYLNDGTYIASAKVPFYAAMLVAGIGESGTTIRYGHHIVLWRDGSESIPASESYDVVADTCNERLDRIIKGQSVSR